MAGEEVSDRYFSCNISITQHFAMNSHSPCGQQSQPYIGEKNVPKDAQKGIQIRP